MTDKFHKNCFVCSGNSDNGLKLKYTFLHNRLSGEFKIPCDYQGYDNIAHGGIIAAILDSSMVHLFYERYGLQLKTAKLNIYFRKEIPVNKKFIVTAVADDTARHFYVAKSKIKNGDTLFAEAEGYFIKCK